MAEGPKVKASVETMAYYNMILTEAIFQLLEEIDRRLLFCLYIA
jgi:hypothetical protein